MRAASAMVDNFSALMPVTSGQIDGPCSATHAHPSGTGGSRTFRAWRAEHVVEAPGVGGVQLRRLCWVDDEQVAGGAKLLKLGLGARRGFSKVAGEKSGA